METNLRSLFAFFLLLVSFLAGKYMPFYHEFYSQNVYTLLNFAAVVV